jgi:hypothetical protein
MNSTKLATVLPILLAFFPSTAREARADGDADAKNDDAHAYVVVFGTQGNPDLARSSHTWATFILTRGGVVQDEETISWLPSEGYFGPDGTMPVLARVPGTNYDLDQTLGFTRNRQRMSWGPYEIDMGLYQRAVTRVAFLASGGTDYKMFVLLERVRAPALYDQPGGAINCIMALSDIDGYLDTGSSWGFSASSDVVGFFAGQGSILAYPTVHPEIAELIHLPERMGVAAP